MIKPKRQHPIWMITELGKLIKEFILPILFFLIINYKNDALWVTIGTVLLLLFLLYQVISIIFKWKNHTYLLAENHLEINEGKFIAKKRYVTLERIQSYQQQTAFYHHPFQLTSLTIVTGSSDAEHATIKLPMIKQGEANKIIEKIQLSRLENEAETEKLAQHDTKDKTLHYQMTMREIIYFSITSLYLFAAIPIIASIYFKIEEVYSLNNVSLTVYELFNSSFIFIIIAVVSFILILTISGIVITFVRYGQYTIRSDEQHIYISRGILTKTKYIIPRDKINGILIEKRFPRRLFRIVKVKIVSLGDLLEEEYIQTDVLLPFIHEGRIKSLLQEIVPEYKLLSLMERPPRQAYFVNLMQPSFLLIIILFVIFYFWPNFWFIPLIYLLLLVIYRIMHTFFTRYSMSSSTIQLQSGVFATDLFITKFTKIDELVVSDSLLDRKFNLRTLGITTRAKPLHMAVVEHVPHTFALDAFKTFKQVNK